MIHKKSPAVSHPPRGITGVGRRGVTMAVSGGQIVCTFSDDVMQRSCCDVMGCAFVK